MLFANGPPITTTLQPSNTKLKREHSNKELREGGEGKPRPSKSARRSHHHPPPGAPTAPNIGAAAISMVSDMLNLVKVSSPPFIVRLCK